MNNNTLMNETESNWEMSEQVKLWKSWMYRLVIPLILGLCMIALIFNAVILVALRRAAVRRHKATLRLTASLTTSDIWTSLVVAISLVYNSYLPQVYRVNGHPCISLTLEMVRAGGLITGTLHFLLLAFNHYIGIIHPFRYEQIMNRYKTAIAICLIWLLPPLLLICYASLQDNQGYRNCSIVLFYHTKAFRWTISGLLASLFLIITSLYIKVLCLAQSLTRKWSAAQRSKRSQSQRLERQQKTIKTTALICGTFFIGWAPACIHFAITCHQCPVMSSHNRLYHFQFIFIFSAIQIVFIMCKSIMNPIIYAIRVPEIEQQVRKLTILSHLTRASQEEAPTTGPSAFDFNQINGDQHSRGGSFRHFSFKKRKMTNHNTKPQQEVFI